MELAYYISEIRQGLPTDWKHIDDRMIIRLINQFRTVYIKNHYNQNRSIDKALTQTINLELKVKDQSTMNYISTTFRILRSVQTIPKILKLSHRDLVISARNAKILSESYNYISKDQAIYAGNGKVNYKDIFCFITDFEGNEYLHVKLKKENPKLNLLTHVSIEAVFENPLDCMILQYPDTYDDDGETYLEDRDYDYPMTDTIWGYIKKNILTDGLNVIQTDIEDETEN